MCEVGGMKTLMQTPEGPNPTCGPFMPCSLPPAPPPCPILQPAAMCCMVVPPPCAAPTYPQPVKPLMMPTMDECGPWPDLTEDQEAFYRYSNFYNNYNYDYHTKSPCCKPCKVVPGVGTCPIPRYCEDYRRKKPRPPPEEAGCPTGFKPCEIKMIPPLDNHPCSVWTGIIQNCKKKPKPPKFYNPGRCKRPGCRHRPSSGKCMYDLPCKASCFKHIPGIHPCNPWLD